MLDESDYEYQYVMPPSTYKEDFNYMTCGVPSVATAKGEETLFYDTAYHTNADSEKVVEFDEDAWIGCILFTQGLCMLLMILPQDLWISEHVFF